MIRTSTALLAVVAAGSAAWTNAQSSDDSKPSPYAMAEGSVITIDGTVDSVSPDSFVLDYGKDVVTVEFDDGDRDSDAYKFVNGDRVSVTGLIDDDFYEMTTIEASSVYVENINTSFYASAVDEEDRVVWVNTPLVISSYTVHGTVSDTDDDSFTLDTGMRELTVDTEDMLYDPLDDVGYQKIEEGDIVSVSGYLDGGLFGDQEVDARFITTLFDSGE